MTESEQLQMWCDYYKATNLKMNALLAILENAGEAMLQKVLKRLGLGSPLDVIKACK